MLTDFAEGTIAKRRLILRDSLAIFSLFLVTIVLFVVTYFLFRSFSVHRANLAQRWSERGRDALQAGKADEAIVDLRAALSDAPGTRAYELLLAQALGETGRKEETEESYQYFLGLWQTEPGDGFINLQLARLAAKRNDSQAAVNFYRASIYGTWEGDGVARRAEVRLELARYLIATHNPAAARMELLIAGGNAPDDYGRDLTLGDLLLQSGDPADAWTYYQKAMAAKPGDPVPVAAAGRLAYQSGDYQDARRLLERAQADHEASQTSSEQNESDVTLMNNAARILELAPLPSLPARERVSRILAARMIARKRFDACCARFAPPGQLPQGLQALNTRWSGEEGTGNAQALLRDASLQDAAMQLVYDTEVQTQQACGAPAGDDALLLRLATTPLTNAPPSAGNAAQTTIPRNGT